MRGRPTTGAMGAAAPGPGGSATLASATAVRSPSLVSASAPGGGSKRDRQGTIRALVAAAGIGSQQELVDQLNDRGFAVTQATVSRDIAELGLVKAPRDGRHVYVLPETLAATMAAADPGRRSDERLRRILADIPVTVGRSGLILLITGSPGTASVIAQAIDESSLTEQEGTLAGDNTLLVLFADDARLATWRERFDDIRTSAVTGSLGGPLIP
jgi:transcriptional regulator of arginine metabolism